MQVGRQPRCRFCMRHPMRRLRYMPSAVVAGPSFLHLTLMRPVCIHVPMCTTAFGGGACTRSEAGLPRTAVVGVLGGGQLGRMMALAAVSRLGAACCTDMMLRWAGRERGFTHLGTHLTPGGCCCCCCCCCGLTCGRAALCATDAATYMWLLRLRASTCLRVTHVSEHSPGQACRSCCKITRRDHH